MLATWICQRKIVQLHHLLLLLLLLERVFLSTYDLSLVDTLSVAHDCSVARVIELLMSKGSVACDLALDQAESLILVLRASTVNRTVTALWSPLSLAAIQKETCVR